MVYDLVEGNEFAEELKIHLFTIGIALRFKSLSNMT
jgi:hypothetical protein